MSERFTYLITRWLDGTATKEEQKELWGLSLEAAHQDQLNTELESAWTMVTAEESMSVEKVDQLFEKLGSEPVRVIDLERKQQRKRRLFWSMAAAAVIILAIGGANWLLNPPVQRKPVAVQDTHRDVQPGGNKAVLTLANGNKIVLDSAADGLLTKQGRVNIVKVADGQLAYKGRDNAGSFNTLTTPYGGMYRLILPDGTAVWLNAASAITYPTAFAGPKREVLVKGEAYFEVEKDASKPFIVNVNDHSIIEVLGTHFNVNAYDNEDSISTTLLEGSVKVTAGNIADKEHQVTLKPGQQMLIDADDRRVKVINNLDPDRIIAWKNGLFNFEGMPLERAMRQLARWYNIEIVYEQPIRAIQFGGTLKRNLPLSGILHFLEGAGLHYRLEDKNRLIILKD